MDQKNEKAPRVESLRDERTGSAAAAARIHNQTQWVDQQIRVAMAQGEFDDLPGNGKPIEDLGSHHDPDWWLKKLIEREQITGVLPPSLQLRKEDAELDQRLDKHTAEVEARKVVEDFNTRVLKARYTPTEGPPLITMPRDVDETLTAWRQRREQRHAAFLAAKASEPAAAPTKRNWWRRRTKPADT